MAQKKRTAKLSTKFEISEKEFKFFSNNPQFEANPYTEDGKFFIIVHDQDHLNVVNNYLNEYKFVFKKNSWHAKMIKYIWGYSPNDFPFVCNYFWLAVFTTVIFLPVFIIKNLAFFLVESIKFLFTNPLVKAISSWVNKLVSRFDHYLDQRFEARVQNYLKEMLEAAEKNDTKRMVNFYRRAAYKSCKLESAVLDKIHEYHSDVRLKIRDSYHKYRDSSNDTTIKPKRSPIIRPISKPRKQEINELLSVIKPVAVAIMYIIGFIIAVVSTIALISFLVWVVPYIGSGIMYIYTHVDWKTFASVTTIILGIILGSGILLAILFNIIKSLLNMMPSITCPDFKFIRTTWKFLKNAIALLVKWCFMPLVWIVNGLVAIWHIIKALKSENCPAIEWEDED